MNVHGQFNTTAGPPPVSRYPQPDAIRQFNGAPNASQFNPAGQHPTAGQPSWPPVTGHPTHVLGQSAILTPPAPSAAATAALINQQQHMLRYQQQFNQYQQQVGQLLQSGGAPQHPAQVPPRHLPFVQTKGILSPVRSSRRSST